ncbi:MAG: SH3 domain-containing protein [Candidatus Paceibacterota bacterium]
MIILFLSNNVFSQDSYVVNTPTLNVRTEPSIKANIIGKLEAGDVVSVINSDNTEWWKISFYGTEGYVAAKFLITLEKSEQYKDWEKESSSTGDKPECENISPEYDYNLKNKLLINVGNNTDVVVKLMKYSGDCIRIAYIKAGDNYSIQNIPEGYYYLKIAYGKDFRKYTKDGQCIVKFMRDASYEKGSEKLDFYKIKKPNTIEGDYEYENWEVPSFELSLNIEYTKNTKYTSDSFHDFQSNKISESEFNK